MLIAVDCFAMYDGKPENMIIYIYIIYVLQSSDMYDDSATENVHSVVNAACLSCMNSSLCDIVISIVFLF